VAARRIDGLLSTIDTAPDGRPRSLGTAERWD
jgi:hypothetical protein